MICSKCGTENRAGRRFCSECGSALTTGCPSCGTPHEAGEKFCGVCGTPLTTGTTAPVAPSRAVPLGAPPAAAPVAERRLVSVLFADLVGFTTLAEGRDAEAHGSCSPATSTSQPR